MPVLVGRPLLEYETYRFKITIWLFFSYTFILYNMHNITYILASNTVIYFSFFFLTKTADYYTIVHYDPHCVICKIHTTHCIRHCRYVYCTLLLGRYHKSHFIHNTLTRVWARLYRFCVYTFGQLLNLISHSLIDVIPFINHCHRRTALIDIKQIHYTRTSQ